MLVCHALLTTACLVPTSIPGARLASLTEVTKHVIPREWLYSLLPGVQFYIPEAVFNHAERPEWEFNFSS